MRDEILESAYELVVVVFGSSVMFAAIQPAPPRESHELPTILPPSSGRSHGLRAWRDVAFASGDLLTVELIRRLDLRRILCRGIVPTGQELRREVGSLLHR
jgi:hypothetical protein